MARERPNIVFVHVDQMHFRATSALGNPHVKTPGIDRLVEDGHTFELMHATMPQCCPARATWYTGRMAVETGVPVNGHPLRPDLPDLGQWLRRHGGYDCVYAGKWHVPNRDVAKSFRMIFASGKGEFADAPIARACAGWLANRRGDEPFFLNVGFMNPHDCCYTAGAGGGSGKFRFAREIERELPPLPESFREAPRYAARTAGWGELEWRYYIYSYYRQVEMVDAEIGRLYRALAASRFAEDTLVIFTSDHGDGLGFHGHISKGYLEDEAWRVPATVVFPGRVARGRRDAEHFVSGVDIPATICDYAGAPPLPKMTVGRSWRGLLEGRSVDWRDHVIGEVPGLRMQAAVRDRRNKTILYPDAPSRVFDMVADPLEMKDIAATDEGKSVEARHRKHMRDYVSKIELAPVPTWGKVSAAQKQTCERYNAWYRRLGEGG
jgi:choline-sulfatase